MQALLRTIISRGVRLMFFSQNPFCATYFFLQAKNVSQTTCGRRAGCCLKKGMDAGMQSTF
jgi:hypothetical protein